MPRGEILDIWLDTATRKRKEETKGDHTGAGDDPAAGIPSMGALTLTLTGMLSRHVMLCLGTSKLLSMSSEWLAKYQVPTQLVASQVCRIAWPSELLHANEWAGRGSEVYGALCGIEAVFRPVFFCT